MFRVTKFGVAVVLGLTFVLSAFSSGAFAQSVNQSMANGAVHRTVTQEQAPRFTGRWTVDRMRENNWWGNRWQHDCGRRVNCHWQIGHNGCARVVRWAGSRHAVSSIVYWVCRR